MKDLYTPEAFAAVQGRLNRRLLALGAVLALFAAVFVYSMVIRLEWLSMLSAVLMGFAAILVVELFCRPLIDYRRLIRTALTGRSHVRTMAFVRAEPDLSTVDGVPCRGLIFLGDPDKHGDRDQLFYWDSRLPLPDLITGREYEIKYTGKNIIGI